MPASFNTGNKLEKHCEICGKDAPFGFGVQIHHAVKFFEKNAKIQSKKSLGKWYCKEHKSTIDIQKSLF